VIDESGAVRTMYGTLWQHARQNAGGCSDSRT
jgi:hypothetical protein